MLRRTKIYLRGAYGPGNLGDDVLLSCMIKILKRKFSSHDIAVSVSNLELARYIDKNINWIPLNAPVFADFSILGGGGQFFSFSSNLVNKRTRISIRDWFKLKYHQGYTFFDLFIGFLLRKMCGIGYISKKLAIFCVGVGPFENGFDIHYYRALKVFKLADFISVRDLESKLNVLEMSKKNAYQFVDITLNRDLWYNGTKKFVQRKERKKKPIVGIVIRDWHLNEYGAKVINDLLDFEKINSRYTCIYISFYKNYDTSILNQLKGRKTLVWDPQEYTVNSFISKMKELCDVIVSSRAHGVLLPTMAYIPTIAVEIEQKLKAVHKMMPLSTKIISGDCLDNLPEMIEECLEYNQSFVDKVNNDIEDNLLLARESVVKLENWYRHVK